MGTVVSRAHPDFTRFVKIIMSSFNTKMILIIYFCNLTTYFFVLSSIFCLVFPSFFQIYIFYISFFFRTNSHSTSHARRRRMVSRVVRSLAGLLVTSEWVDESNCRWVDESMCRWVDESMSPCADESMSRCRSVIAGCNISERWSLLGEPSKSTSSVSTWR